MGRKVESVPLSGKVRIVGEKFDDISAYVKLSVEDGEGDKNILTIPRGRLKTVFLDRLISACREEGETVEFEGKVSTSYRRLLFKLRPVDRIYEGRMRTGNKSYDITYSERLGDGEESYDQIFEIEEILKYQEVTA